MKKSERIKTEVSLRQVAESAGVSWDLHKSQPKKGDWWGPCPFHHEATASFHVVEKGGTAGFFKCFGCHKGGTVIDFAMEIHGLDFTSAIRRLAEDAGIAGELSEDRKRELEKKRQEGKAKAEKEAARKAASGHRVALNLWTRARLAQPDDMLAAYLTARGINLATMGGTPATLRLHMALPHRENGGQVVHTGPAMVAGIGRDKVLGVHRTWIAKDGRAHHPDGRKVSKQWIGQTGGLMGQPVVLSTPTPSVVVGEGIETTLAGLASLLTAGTLGWSAEAALSRGAITGPASDPAQLWTPRPGTKDVLVLGEGSAKNPAEAERLYKTAAARLEGQGLRVLLAVPGGRWDMDADFADTSLSEYLKG